MTVVNMSSVRTASLHLPEPEPGQWVVICDATCVDLALREAVKLCAEGTPFVVYELMPGPTNEAPELLEIQRCD